jgi:hypothetical protein
MRRLGRYRLGAWLGVLAVAFYAWLPGHFAAHVAHTALDALAALDGGHRDGAASRHPQHPPGHDEHHGGTCPICAAAAASAAPAAAMLLVPVLLPSPRPTAAPPGIAEASVPLISAALTPYASRGPPPAA